MGGISSSRHVAFDSDNEEGITFVKGIRLSERVIDRMRESPSVARLQTSTKLSRTSPPVAPQVEHSPPGERHVPVMPHPPSYASTLVPPLSEPITPLVPLIPVTEESPAPPPTVQSAPLPAQPKGLLTPQPGDENAVLYPPGEPASVTPPQPVDPPAELINVPSQASSKTITDPLFVELTSTPAESITSTTVPETHPPPSLVEAITSKPVITPVEPLDVSAEPITMPVEHVVLPTESADIPVKLVTPPTESVCTVVESVASPFESAVVPSESVATLVESVAISVESVDTPVESITSPVESVVVLGESVRTLVESVASPVESVASPVESVASPVESVASPVESVVSPVESIVPSELIATHGEAVDVPSPSTQPVEPVDIPEVSTSPVTLLSVQSPPPENPVSVPELMSVGPVASPSSVSIPATVPSLVEESMVPPSPSTSAVELSNETPSMVEMGPSSIEEPPAPHLPLVEEPVIPPFLNPVGSLSPPPQTQTKVNEKELRTQIKEELQKLLKVEIKMTELKIRQQLEEEKVKAKAQAQAAARLQIQKEVQKVLEEEKVSYQQTLADAIRREQLNIQDEHLIAQYYAQKLEEKQKDLEKQDGLFQDQIAKMQEKAAQFTKVTSENYKKGLEDTHNRFRRYQIKPVCSDLQSQILKCYAENKGQTLTCSNIASLYIQCVDRAKQDIKLSTGG
ncbi:coiled-coil-helix-coiled-coil-helix domain containing 3b isoform X2 [Myxocyprinus asiaticus]|uniref:coiled-coil-helix-coiled-coil-helix domain containing 3b isoform X2 n=1 Tax=Myxocyprinus asiaticus TaxID=70543 RepID=UPI002222C0BC|nr:coiled-coil-helix-coiled-coil-helix domain containing 3b isoform X2 [Myxocyprinus asiaticus]